MNKIRLPSVADVFYPANPEQLMQIVGQYLDDAKTTAKVPKAVIVPHAGFVYSGPVAASAYARLHAARKTISRVILVGPSHRIGFTGLAVSSDDFFRSPLGDIPVDVDAIKLINDFPFVNFIDQAHQFEHSLEVQLPFLQQTLAKFTLVPIVVGDASVEQVSKVLDKLWGGTETLIVISSDLSHYHDYETAQRLDKITSEKIENRQFEQLDIESACGRLAISGLLAQTRQRSLSVKTIDLRNSGDTAGDKNRVVGYGAYVIE